jgi:hypothetical protein
MDFKLSMAVYGILRFLVEEILSGGRWIEIKNYDSL